MISPPEIKGFSSLYARKTANEKMFAYEQYDGTSKISGFHFEYDEMEGDHIKPWSLGGKTIQDNCQMLCKDCNSQKTNKY